jgi:hypothetical protein
LSRNRQSSSASYSPGESFGVYDGLDAALHVTDDDLARRMTLLQEHSGLEVRLPPVAVRPRLAVHRDLKFRAGIFVVHSLTTALNTNGRVAKEMSGIGGQTGKHLLVLSFTGFGPTRTLGNVRNLVAIGGKADTRSQCGASRRWCGAGNTAALLITATNAM